MSFFPFLFFVRNIQSDIVQLMPGHFETTERVCNGSLWALRSEKRKKRSSEKSWYVSSQKQCNINTGWVRCLCDSSSIAQRCFVNRYPGEWIRFRHDQRMCMRRSSNTEIMSWLCVSNIWIWHKCTTHTHTNNSVKQQIFISNSATNRPVNIKAGLAFHNVLDAIMRPMQHIYYPGLQQKTRRRDGKFLSKLLWVQHQGQLLCYCRRSLRAFPLFLDFQRPDRLVYKLQTIWHFVEWITFSCMTSSHLMPENAACKSRNKKASVIVGLSRAMLKTHRHCCPPP